MCLHSTWTEEFYRGSYEYSFLDHGGVIVAVSRYSSNTVYTKSITFSCTEGLSWREMNISVAPAARKHQRSGSAAPES